MTECVLSVDIGTTSLKAGLVTADGEVVFVFRKKYKNPQSKTVATQWENVFTLAYEKADLYCQKNDFVIKGIGISGNGPTIVSDGGVTLLWNSSNVTDKSLLNLPDELKVSLSKVRSLFLPRILLFKQLYPEEFIQSESIFSGPEYLIYKLTNTKITILPEARYESAYWNEQLLKDFDIDPKKMPSYVGTASFCGYWNDLPIYAGGPDFIVALIGTNTLRAGMVCDRSGSSEGINFCVAKPVFENGIRTLPSVIPDLWNCSVLIPNSSKLKVENRIQKLKSAVQLLRKTAAKYHLDFPDEMTVTGGQTKDHIWMKEKSVFLGIKLKVCSCSDSELLGDASVAWFGLGKYSSLPDAAEKIVKIDREYRPL